MRIVRRLVVLLSGIGVLAALPSVAVAEDCPNAEFRVGPSASLPDCRAYEQVTPVEKNAGIFYVNKFGRSVDGAPNLVIESFASIAGLQDNNGAPGGFYVSVRSGSGWATSPLPLPASEYETAVVVGGITPYLAGSLDGRSALWQAHRRGQPEGRVDFYVTRPGGTIEDVGTVTPPGTLPGEVPNVTEGLGIDPAGESDDLSHIVYQMKPQAGYSFWPSDTTNKGGEDLYEFVGAENATPMLVGVDDGGKLISNCGTALGRGEGGGINKDHNSMSEDGNTVFFTALACGSSPAVNELFARIGNGQPDAHTVALSEPSTADCAACDTSADVLRPAVFMGASVDGSKVFFTTEQPLLDGDVSANIYEYDLDAPAGERVTRVSGGDATVSNPVAEVEGVVQTSEDGSHVYFVAHGVLTTTPNSRGQVANTGANNLYVFERDAQYPAGHTEFIAGLSANDETLWAESFGADSHSNVTPDGRFLVFVSKTEHLTPDDTSTAAQVFEYEAQTGRLVRVSIGQDGYNDNGNTDAAEAPEAPIVFPHYNYSESNEYPSGLSVSADGSYVFFQSTDGLTPRAFNHKLLAEECKASFDEAFCQPPLLEEFESALEELHDLTKVYANNIYEYHDGNVSLISDGRDVSVERGGSIALLGTDESGADVFFTSADQLSPTDADTNLDIYDARVDGGFSAPVSPPECTGDACQGPLSPAPILLSPGSEFQAGGNAPLAAASRPVATKPKPKTKKAKRKPKKTSGRRGRKVRRAATVRGHAQRNGGRS